MSANSNYGKGLQDLFGKMKSNRPAPLKEVKQEKVTPNAEYSKAIRGVSSKGYEVYNVEDVGEVFIAKAPESAFFNNGEDCITKAESGKMVGLYRPKADEEIKKVVTENKQVTVNMMFQGIKRGSDLQVDAFTGSFSNGVFKKTVKDTERSLL